jgi:predicted porin
MVGQDRDGVDVFQTSEIIFTPSVTLDNGLTFGMNIQLESFGSVGDTIDESYMTISSDTLGTITIGSENSEGYRHMIGAPVVTSMWINSPSVSAYIPFTASSAAPALSGTNGFRTAMISSYTEVGGNNDAERISYRTPSFNGFTLGVSYARDGGQDNFSAPSDTAAGTGTLHDIFDIGVGYSGSFGGTDISLAARWGTGDVASTAAVIAGAATAGADGLDGTADDVAAGDVLSAASAGGTAETWAVGVNVGFGGFTVGGSYAENDNPGTAADSSGWSFGASFDTAGPWSFALSTYQGESDAPGSMEEYTAYKLGASRDLGPGVDLDIFAIQLEAKNTAGMNVDGTVIGTQINLSF